MGKKTNSGSVLGGILLVTGSCVGAGMLALPILTGLAGFFPSLVMMVVACTFMTLSALLMVEVNSWFKYQVNIVSMADHTLGKMGRIMSWGLYLFLFYSLGVAYISGSGGLTSTFFQVVFSLPFPTWAGSLIFVILFGSVVYCGTRTVDLWNRVLMGGKILTFLGLIFLGVTHLQGKRLLHTDLGYTFFSLPILVISFGYHNMIPTLTAYLKNDLRKMRITILGGSCLIFTIYLIWNTLVLGILPVTGQWGIVESFHAGREASEALAQLLGISWISTCAQGLAFFALLTSFLAQTLGLVHFLADGMGRREEEGRKGVRVFCTVLSLLPPLVFSFLYPQLFIKALNFAGGICAVVLFGALPVAMVWIGRYSRGIIAPYRVRGGKSLLIGVFLFALFIFCFQLIGMVI